MAEVELPARPSISVHVPKADGALVPRLHRQPLLGVLGKHVVTGLWHWVGWIRLRCRWWNWLCWWHLTSEHGTTNGEVVLEKVVQEIMVPPSTRLNSTTVEHLSKRLSLLARPLKSRVCNWLLYSRGIMLLLLLLVVAWLSWGPGMEVGSVESDMVLPYVATKALKSRTGSKLNKIKIRAVV